MAKDLDIAQISKLPAGSTVILSTTSPDKKREYAEIFKRFDINFFTLEDFGLSPQKTDEMTGNYGGNLIQKAEMVSYTLHKFEDRIRAAMGEKGIAHEGKPIVGMVEDSGIEIYPKREDKREEFNGYFIELLKEAIYENFSKHPDARARLFPGLDDAAVDARLNAMTQNLNWMFLIDPKISFPGPNYKPIFEALQGGFSQFVEIVYDAARVLEDTPETKGQVATEQMVRYRNRSQAMIVPALEKPEGRFSETDIMEGVNRGWFFPYDEFQKRLAEFRESDERVFRKGDIFTNAFTTPSGQTPRHSRTQRELSDDPAFLASNDGEVAYYARLQIANEFGQRYGVPLYAEQTRPERWVNPEPVNVLIMHADPEQPNLAKAFQRKIEADTSLSTITMPDAQTLLNDPNARLMDGADVVFLMPSESGKDLDNARLLLGATVDKQVMPYAKEKTIIVLNPKKQGQDGAFDPALKLLRNAHLSGLKNGLSEIDHIIEYDPDEYKGEEGATRLYDSVRNTVIAAERDWKDRKITSAEELQRKKDIAPATLESLPEDRFTIFAAGGSAIEYPEFKEPANRLGRFIHDQGWTLVTGAGQKDGPMGAIHSGFVEAYLSDKFGLNPEKTENTLPSASLKEVQDVIKRQIHGIIPITAPRAAEHINALYDAVFKNPNAEFLGVEAPKLLKTLLSPKAGSPSAQLMGSLEDSHRLLGYSMPPLLTSEGSGKPPPGMYYQNAGNMQRRMHEMSKAAVHLFLAGSQGTQQELVESLLYAIEQNAETVANGGAPKDILILNQPTFNGSTVFADALKLAETQLKQAHSERSLDELGVRVFDNSRALEQELQQSYQRWEQNRERA